MMKSSMFLAVSMVALSFMTAFTIPWALNSNSAVGEITFTSGLNRFFDDVREVNQSFNTSSFIVKTDACQAGAFDIPPELIALLPPGQRILSNNRCFFSPAYAVVGFDASVGGNDGKGFSFIFSINTMNPELKNDETLALKEILAMSLENDMMLIRQQKHPKTNKKLTDTVIKHWGCGGSYKWTIEWDGQEIPVYSCYYLGKVNEIYFTLIADGPNTSVPEQLADKVAQLAEKRMIYN